MQLAQAHGEGHFQVQLNDTLFHQAARIFIFLPQGKFTILAISETRAIL